MTISAASLAFASSINVNPPPREVQRDAPPRPQPASTPEAPTVTAQPERRQAPTSAVFEQAERFRQSRTQREDEPSPRSQLAIQTYQSLALEERRSEVQQLLGVDTFV